MGFGLNLAGPLHGKTRVTASLFRGPVDLLSVLALTPRHGTTVRVELLNPKWQATMGDFNSLRHALNPTTIQADGAAFQYRGRVVGDLWVGRRNISAAAGEDTLHSHV
jgi:hypothetical protein